MDRHIQTLKLLALSMGIVLLVAVKLCWDYVDLRSTLRMMEPRVIAYSLMTLKAEPNGESLHLSDQAPAEIVRRFEQPWGDRTIEGVMANLDADCSTVWFGSFPLPGGGIVSWDRQALDSPESGPLDPRLTEVVSLLRKNDRADLESSKNSELPPQYCLYRIANMGGVRQPYAFVMASGYVGGSHHGYTVIRRAVVYFPDDVEIVPASRQGVQPVPAPMFFTADTLASWIAALGGQSGIDVTDPAYVYALLKQRAETQSVTVPVLSVELPATLAIFVLQVLSLVQLLMLSNVVREANVLRSRGRTEPWAVLAMSEGDNWMDRATAVVTSKVGLAGFWLSAATPVVVGVIGGIALSDSGHGLFLLQLWFVVPVLAARPLWQTVRGSFALSRVEALHRPGANESPHRGPATGPRGSLS